MVVLEQYKKIETCVLLGLLPWDVHFALKKCNCQLLICLLPKLHWEWRSCACVQLSSSARLTLKAAFVVKASEQEMDLAAFLEVFPVFTGDVTGWPSVALIVTPPTAWC